jgi:hypothetical protein
LAQLRAHADDPGTGRELLSVRRQNKLRLGARVRRELGLTLDPDTLFDAQAKRIHEYKRQLLTCCTWSRATRRSLPIRGAGGATHGAAGRQGGLGLPLGQADHPARARHRARGQLDPRCAGKLQLVFLPNYGVSLAEAIIPAADLSEQISLAGTEASGTGNMKFALNGALTIGTWDGANIEMAEAIGEAGTVRVRPARRGRARGARARLRPAPARGREPAAARGARRDRRGGLLARRRAPLPPAHRRPARPGQLPAARRLRRLREAQSRVDALYAEPAAWGGARLAQHAGMGSFFRRPHRRRVRAQDLVGTGRAERARRMPDLLPGPLLPADELLAFREAGWHGPTCGWGALPDAARGHRRRALRGVGAARQRASVVGDFNDWTAVGSPMRRREGSGRVGGLHPRASLPARATSTSCTTPPARCCR